MEKDAGFWLTREITDVDVLVTAEQERARGEAFRVDLNFGTVPSCLILSISIYNKPARCCRVELRFEIFES